MNTAAIIQARMGSTRLPGKMLMNIAGKPAIEHVIERIRQAKRVEQIVLATTTAPADDALCRWAKEREVLVYRGSEQDVLDRYYQCAKEYGARVVVRLTGDCPLLDPEIIDAVIGVFEDGNCDYASNIHPPSYPDGLDVEVFSFQALEKAWTEAKFPSEREHVTPYMWKHPELFRMKNYELRIKGEAVDMSTERWTLDTPEDLEFMERVIPCCRDFSFGTVMEVLKKHPEWRAINARFRRNEGYEKSLQSEK